METSIKDFCDDYLKKLQNDKDIEANPIDWYQDARDRISFRVYKTDFCPMVRPRFMFEYCGEPSITLDNEDLKYLYDKYSKKLQEEMNENIENVKALYSK